MAKLVALGFLVFVCLASEAKSKKGGYGGYGGYGGGRDPCNNYQELSEYNRAASYSTLTKNTDKDKTWRDDWYRFTGEAGDKIASLDTTGDCLTSPSCGAKYPGFLSGSHPKDLEPGKEIKRSLCFSKNDKCCYKTVMITIRKCQGFWIYALPRPSLKGARYCGNKVRETKPECDEKKLLYGLNKKNAAKSCKEIKKRNKNAESGVYWINPDGNNPTQAYCDQETDGGGWTLVYSYTFTNFGSFGSSSNANTPRPSWPTYGDIPVSTTAPVSETDYNAMDFNQWKNLGREFMIKSNINHWIACKDETGSLVEFRAGSLQCRNIKNVATKCHGYVPDQLIFNTAGNPNGMSVGPDLIRSQSNTRLKEYYYFDGNTRTNWPTHDPCGTNGKNHLTNVANPHGNVYIRE